MDWIHTLHICLKLSTSSAEHDRPAPSSAVDDNSVINAVTLKTEVEIQNKSLSAMKADFRVETENANKLLSNEYRFSFQSLPLLLSQSSVFHVCRQKF